MGVLGKEGEVGLGVEDRVGVEVRMRGCLGRCVSCRYDSNWGQVEADCSVKGNDKLSESQPPATTTTTTTAVDPSEAPSSPTIAETPIKKGHSQHPLDDEGEMGTGHRTPIDDIAKRPVQPHVAFAPLTTEDQPRSSLSTDARPVPGNLAIPDRHISGDTLSPAQGPGTAGLPPSPATARSDLPVGLHAQPGGSGSAIIDDDEGNGREGSFMTDSIVPEGMGSKRLYKMSKMFSESFLLGYAIDNGDKRLIG